MSYIKPQDQIQDGVVNRSPTENAVYDALALKADTNLQNLSFSGLDGQVITLVAGVPAWAALPASGVTSVTASAPLASSGGTTPNLSISQASALSDGYLSSADWTTFNNKQPAGSYANASLNNLSSPTAISQDLSFNKATAAIVNGSDAKATQANHDLTIRAGNTGSSVVGGNLYLYPGTSTNNGGSIYLDISGGTTSATRRIYFIGSGSTTVAEFQTNVARFNANLTFATDNSNTIGTFTANRPSQVFAATQMQIGTTSGVLSGLEKTDDNGAAPGALTVRGGNGANSSNPRGTNPGGNLTLHGGDHAGATGTQGTQAAGNVTLRGGDKTAGTGNGGSVTISGGTSVGGTAGSIIANTAGVERLRIKNATEVVVNDTGVDFDFRVEGDTDANLVFVDASADKVGIGTATPAEKLEVSGNIKVTSGDVIIATAGDGLSIKEGSNAKMGVTTAFPTGNPNRFTVSTTAITANSRIFLTIQDYTGAHNPSVKVYSRDVGAGNFIIEAGDNSFNGTVAWMLVEPA
jgi:hypothetical protein